MRLIDADALPVITDWSKQYVLFTAIQSAPTIDPIHAAGGVQVRGVQTL